MLDYIGGNIAHVASTRSGHRVTLWLQCGADERIEWRCHVRGPRPGLPGERLAVMLLADDVVGWHNRATGAQGHLLNSLPKVRWQRRDTFIALAVGLVLGSAGYNVLLGLTAGLGWLLSAVLWRVHALRSARAELTEALTLAAGLVVSSD